MIGIHTYLKIPDNALSNFWHEGVASVEMYVCVCAHVCEHPPQDSVILSLCLHPGGDNSRLCGNQEEVMKEEEKKTHGLNANIQQMAYIFIR